METKSLFVQLSQLHSAAKSHNATEKMLAFPLPSITYPIIEEPIPPSGDYETLVEMFVPDYPPGCPKSKTTQNDSQPDEWWITLARDHSYVSSLIHSGLLPLPMLLSEMEVPGMNTGNGNMNVPTLSPFIAAMAYLESIGEGFSGLQFHSAKKPFRKINSSSSSSSSTVASKPVSVPSNCRSAFASNMYRALHGSNDYPESVLQELVSCAYLQDSLPEPDVISTALAFIRSTEQNVSASSGVKRSKMLSISNRKPIQQTSSTAMASLQASSSSSSSSESIHTAGASVSDNASSTNHVTTDDCSGAVALLTLMADYAAFAGVSFAKKHEEIAVMKKSDSVVAVTMKPDPVVMPARRSTTWVRTGAAKEAAAAAVATTAAAVSNPTLIPQPNPMNPMAANDVSRGKTKRKAVEMTDTSVPVTTIAPPDLETKIPVPSGVAITSSSSSSSAAPTVATAMSTTAASRPSKRRKALPNVGAEPVSSIITDTHLKKSVDGQSVVERRGARGSNLNSAIV